MKAFHLILGPMFSGKTTRLLDYFDADEKKVAAFKPEIDTRYLNDKICTHDGQSINARVINLSADIKLSEIEADVVLFDEVQFFDKSIIPLIKALLQTGKKVVASGLDQDYKKQPFPTIELLKKIATQQTYLLAKCHQCGDDAAFTYLKVPTSIEGQVFVGGEEKYEARCNKCFHDAETQ